MGEQPIRCPRLSWLLHVWSFGCR